MLPSERRSTVRVNKERLKAAMEAADRAEAGVASKDACGVWTKLNSLLLQADEISDKIKTFDLNVPIAAGVATTVGTFFNAKSLNIGINSCGDQARYVSV